MTGRPNPHWRCAWCLYWNLNEDVYCDKCGRDLEI
jgi:hypothetical protein